MGKGVILKGLMMPCWSRAKVIPFSRPAKLGSGSRLRKVCCWGTLTEKDLSSRTWIPPGFEFGNWIDLPVASTSDDGDMSLWWKLVSGTATIWWALFLNELCQEDLEQILFLILTLDSGEGQSDPRAWTAPPTVPPSCWSTWSWTGRLLSPEHHSYHLLYFSYNNLHVSSPVEAFWRTEA